MICPACDKDVQPLGLATGLQELLAARIHFNKEHRMRVNTIEAAETRVLNEEDAPTGTVWIDVDRDEEWLA